MKQLIQRGFEFSWPEGVYWVFVSYYGKPVGTFKYMAKPYCISREAREAMWDMLYGKGV